MISDSPGTTVEEGRKQSGISLPLLVGLAIFFFIVASPENHLFLDPDTYLHLASGNWILDHYTVPQVDIFSFNTLGQTWVDHEWLSQIVLALAYRLNGFAGVQILVGGVVAITFGYQLRFLLHRVPPMYALLFCALSFVSVMGHLIARPHIFSWPILVFWFASLFKAVEKQELPTYKLTLVMVLWANLHGSFVLGLACLPIFVLEALLQSHPDSRRSVLKHWVLFSALSLLCSVLTPYTWRGLLFAPALMSSEYLNKILEWMPPTGNDLIPIAFWGLLILGMACFGFLRLTIARFILLTGIFYESLMHVRYGSILGLITPLIIALPFGLAYTKRFQSRVKSQKLDGVLERISTPSTHKSFITITAIAFALAVWVLSMHASAPLLSITPKEAVNAAIELPIKGRVLNFYNFGGYLIYRNIPVFIDGRADLYGDQYMGRYFEITQAESFEKLESLLNQSEITWTIFPPNEPIVKVLDQSRLWRRSYADDNAVIHTKVVSN